MTPRFEFMFTHAVLYPAGIIVNEPLGWKTARISLKRDPVYKSLIEYFKGSFIWYGLARNVIKECEALDGPDTQIRVRIRVKHNYTWDVLFNGLLDVLAKEDLSKQGTFYKLGVPIIRDDFWAKFMSGKDKAINLAGDTDIEGNARTVINPVNITLPPQKIRTHFEGTLDHYQFITKWTGDPMPEWSIGNFLQLNVDRNRIDEVEEKFDTTIGFVENMAGVFIAKYAGEYRIKFRVEASLNTTYTDTALGFGVKINIDGAGIAATATNYAGPGPYHSTVSEFDQTLTLAAGDEVFIYADVLVTPGLGISLLIYGNDSPITPPSGQVVDPFTIEVIADTIYPQTTAEAYLIQDAAKSILSKVLCADGVLESSSYLNSCAGKLAILLGLHARGYTIADKLFAITWDDLYAKGFQPLLNTGLGYTDDNTIEIEKASDFYNPTTSIDLVNLGDVVETYDIDKYYNSVDIGCATWSAEAKSGIDDPQTTRQYNNALRTIGKKIEVKTSIILASLAIEETRRQAPDPGKDWKLDNNILGIAVKADGDDYIPEVGTDFQSVTNLLNSDSRYNIRHSCARMFKRWQPWFQMCLQKAVGSFFTFASGEGNYGMVSELKNTDCEYNGEEPLSERQDIEVTTDRTLIPEVGKTSGPMVWEDYKTIRANRKNAIGLKSVPYFIEELDFAVAMGQVEITVLKA